VIIIQTNDQYSFIWNCLAVKYNVKNHRERLSHYKQHFNELITNNQEFLINFPTFEQQNPDFSVSVLSVCEANETYTKVSHIYVSPHTERKYRVIQLLITNKEGRSFFGLVVNPKSLLAKSETGKLYCEKCIHRFCKRNYLKHPCVNQDGATVNKEIKQVTCATKNQALAQELHKTVKQKFKTRPITVKGVDDTWNADLVDMTAFSKENYNYKWILTLIDVMSRYVWVVPLFNKNASSVINGFLSILEDSKRKPKKLWVDEGKEFTNNEFKAFFKEKIGGDPDVDIYHTHGVCKTPILDRFHRSLKTWMWKRFTENGNKQWLCVLHEIIAEYNNKRFHHSLKMTPAEASGLGKLNRSEAEQKLRILQQEKIDSIPWEEPVFDVGDPVRMVKSKGKFEKGYTEKWTREIFTVAEVRLGKPIMYRVKDSNGEIIEGSLYKEELQLSKLLIEENSEQIEHEDFKNKSNDEKSIIDNVYEVEAIVGEKVSRGELYYKVRWFGYTEADDSWERIKNLIGDKGSTGVVDMIKQYQLNNPIINKFSRSTNKITELTKLRSFVI
jgi:hypothetical protein